MTDKAKKNDVDKRTTGPGGHPPPPPPPPPPVEDPK